MIRVVVAHALGVFTWSFAEYVVHRWSGHDVRLRPNPCAAEHVPHHSEGNYFAPVWKKEPAPQWLADPDTGAVRPEHYELIPASCP